MWNVLHALGAALSKLTVAGWLGIYGALLSTILAIREWRKRSRVRVRLVYWEQDAGGSLMPFERLSVVVTNRSDYGVRINLIILSVWRRYRWVDVGGFAPRPRDVVPPHDALESEMAPATTPWEAMKGRCARARVLLTTGERFTSRSVRLTVPTQLGGAA